MNPRIERLRAREVRLLARLEALRTEIETEERIAAHTSAERRRVRAAADAEAKRRARETASAEERREADRARRIIERALLDVALVSGLSTQTIRRGTRRPAVRARWAWLWLARSLTHASLPTIGEVAGRDHTTVLYACSRAMGQRESRVIIEAVLRGRAADVLEEMAA